MRGHAFEQRHHNAMELIRGVVLHGCTLGCGDDPDPSSVFEIGQAFDQFPRFQRVDGSVKRGWAQIQLMRQLGETDSLRGDDVERHELRCAESCLMEAVEVGRLHNLTDGHPGSEKSFGFFP